MSLRVNLIARDNGVGLSNDLRLLRAALVQVGHRVTVSAIGRGTLRKVLRPWQTRAHIATRRLRGRNVQSFDVNLFLERVRAEYFPQARRNVLIPNPEWFNADDEALLKHLDCVFAKTRHAESIFRAHGCNTAFIGFTSPDRHESGVPRVREFFHLAGRSENKNTEPLLALWRCHSQWPKLTVVQSPRTAKPGAAARNIVHRVDYLSDDELRTLQNAHWFHLCPSQTEGFGHYLVEAMSVGAVTLTLNAPPMNELIAPDRGVLVPVIKAGTQNLATTYFFDDAAMQAAVERMIAFDDDELTRIGAAARSWFEHNAQDFPQRLSAALTKLV